MISAEMAFILAGVFLFAGVLASKVAFKFGIPALFLFLVIGMVAGSDGPGGCTSTIQL
jgi:cell volume regulation protein A